MSSATTEAAPAGALAGFARRLAPSRALWLGPQGLWDYGAMPGWPARLGAPLQRPRRHDDFNAWCNAMPGHACTLVLSAWLLHELVLDPALPLADDTARLGHARRQLQHYHGEAAARWPLAAWHAAGQRGVSALHALTLAELQTMARRAAVSLRSVQPWWSLALALAQQQQPRLAAPRARLLVVDGSLVACIDLQRGRLVQLQQRRLGSASAQALLQLQQGLPAVDCCVAIGHGLAPPWSPTASGDIHALGDLSGDAPPGLWPGTSPGAPHPHGALGEQAP